MSEIRIKTDTKPEDAVTSILNAKGGDTVVIDPGTYQFRIYNENPGVVIKSGHPDNRPVFNFEGTPLKFWPGFKQDWIADYAVVLQGNDSVLENIDIRNATGSMDRGLFPGVMGVVREPATPGSMPENIVIRNVAVSGCTEGVSATGINMLFENCQIYDNGIPGQVAAKHNVYLQGGSVTLRKCNLGKALSGQQINSRAQWLLVDDCDLDEVGAFVSLINTPKATMTNGTPHLQEAEFRNSRIKCTRHNGLGLAKAIEVSNFNGYNGLTQKLVLSGNSFSFQPGKTDGVFVILRRAAGTAGMILEASGNQYTGGFGRYLLLPDGDKDNSFYTIGVHDYECDTLPTPATPPTGSVTVNAHFQWEQEKVENLAGWRLYMGSTPNNMAEIANISYISGMKLEHDRVISASTPELFFKIKAYNQYGILSEASGIIEVDIDLPDVDLTPPPAPKNLSVRFL